MVGLKLKRSVVIEVISQTEGGTVPPTNDRTVGRIPIDRFGDASVHVGIAEVRTILAESSRELSIESLRMKYLRDPRYAAGVPNQHAFIKELIFRVFVDDIHGRDEFVMIDVIGECELVVIDGKSGLQPGHRPRTGRQSEIK